MMNRPGSSNIDSHHQLPVERQDFVSQLDLSRAGSWAPLPHLRHPDAAHVYDGALLPPSSRDAVLSTVWVSKNGYVSEAEAELALLVIFGERHCVDLDV